VFRILPFAQKQQTPYTEGLFGVIGATTRKISSHSFRSVTGFPNTQFKYSNLNILQSDDPKDAPVTVEFELSNTGSRAGAEVAEIYVQPINPSVARPVKELKGFEKVFLQPGEKQKVSVTLDKGAFAYYDPAKKDWVAEKGEYKILIGASSRDIRLNYTLTLPGSL